MNHIEKVIMVLRTLHTSGVRFNNDFNVFKEIEIYEELLGRVKDGCMKDIRNYDQVFLPLLTD